MSSDGAARPHRECYAMSAAILAVIGFSTVVTAFISGILGMAGGMILMGVLLALLPVAAAMMLHGVIQLAANAARAWMLRSQIDRRVLTGYALGSFAALGAFALVQLVVSKPVALLALGAMPFIAWMLPKDLRLDVGRRGHPFACGAVCGALSLTAGISGPILDVFFMHSTMGRHAVVATKAATQSLSHLLKIAYFGAIVSATGDEVTPAVAATMVVLAIAGTRASKAVLERIDDSTFRVWTRRVTLTIGAVYLGSAGVMLGG